eukprot:34834_5
MLILILIVFMFLLVAVSEEVFGVGDGLVVDDFQVNLVGVGRGNLDAHDGQERKERKGKQGESNL